MVAILVRLQLLECLEFPEFICYSAEGARRPPLHAPPESFHPTAFQPFSSPRSHTQQSLNDRPLGCHGNVAFFPPLGSVYLGQGLQQKPACCERRRGGGGKELALNQIIPVPCADPISNP